MTEQGTDGIHPTGDTLSLRLAAPVSTVWCGTLVSRGGGRHVDRIGTDHELIFVQSGDLYVEEAGREFHVAAGETLLLYPGRHHSGTREYLDDLVFHFVHFHLTGPAAAAEPLRIAQHHRVVRPELLSDIYHKLLEEVRGGRHNSPTADALTWLILCEAALQPEDVHPAPSGVALAGKANTYVITHFHEPISLATVADALRCNHKYLSRVYRQTYGLTLTEQIHRTRVHYAKRLLVETTHSVAEIARACGFTDTSYFLQIFRRHVGTTALAHRKLHARQDVLTE